MTAPIKQGWVEKPLGEISTLQRGFDLPKRLREPGEFPLVTSSGSTDTHSEAKVRGPGVATGRSGSIGNVFFVEDDFWPLNTALYVKDFHGNDPRFVYHLLNYVDLARFTSGAGVPTLNRNDVHGELYWIPAKIEEQQRIVAVLDEAFEGLTRAREHAEANLRNARELFESQLASYFSRIPQGWVTARLKKITSKIGSGATPKGGASAYKSEGISLFRSLNVHDRRFSEAKLAFLDDEQANRLRNVIVEDGDVLLNITGASIARCCVAPTDFLPARVNQHVSIIRVTRECMLPEFLTFMLTSKPYKNLLLSTGEDNGSTRQALTKSLIENLEVAYPSEVGMQQEIVDALLLAEDLSKKLARSYLTTIQDLDELRQSLLQRAFAGELT